MTTKYIKSRPFEANESNIVEDLLQRIVKIARTKSFGDDEAAYRAFKVIIEAVAAENHKPLVAENQFANDCLHE